MKVLKIILTVFIWVTVLAIFALYVWYNLSGLYARGYCNALGYDWGSATISDFQREIVCESYDNVGWPGTSGGE